ncbi:lipopolysaccharide transport system ATP-binding protein [Pedobacter terrae]|uniref:Lipopolysaccharide transport system ATP-binding protein n=1 Tax=Pedobacter terrae TaxID=405671 RepID=A0A1G7U556_9SPHI|nr:polysaccharide ABC transporter ATP-binding protein [Pedobacter terrae]SDG41890.1 lipopolysaccharide transport system ATP-binding protein [Pedobacter terrae]
MSKNIAIKVENLSKAYQLGQIGTGTISRDLERWFARIRGKDDPFLRIGESNDQNTKSESDVVWSLKDINFEIEQGDAVGIIGRNGAGKSTLLKILSKVTAPTTGKISGHGRIASLLEVGTGFHPELSGRENIFLNGAILGMRKKEIQRKLDEIVDFAGIERYLDTPVKRYSSGMYVRLAFAVAAHLESEILIVDEVLAVGDAEFQKKCLGKMGEVSKGEGRTVLFVSHNMDAISSLCKKGIVLENGLKKTYSKVEDAVKIYQQFNQANILRWDNPKSNYFPRFESAAINITGEQPYLLLNVAVQIIADHNYTPAFITFDIKDDQGKTIIQSMPSASPFIDIQKGVIKIDLSIELTGLVPGFYSVSPWVGPQNTVTFDRQEDALVFEITQSPTKNRVFPYYKSDGFISAPTTFKITHAN